MQGNDAATLGTSPFQLFFARVSICADGFDSEPILDKTDLISLPVTFVETFNGRAGKRPTLKTIMDTMFGSAVFYLTFPTMFRLAIVLGKTSGAGFLHSEMHIANSTGDATRRQHVSLNRLHFHLLIPLVHVLTTGCRNTVFILSGAALRGSLR